MSLTLEEANRIIRGALAKAQELNIKISAAVCDSGGRLISLQRMDNAIWGSAYGSQAKAVSRGMYFMPQSGAGISRSGGRCARAARMRTATVSGVSGSGSPMLMT